jgi:hypothetical protein
MRKERESDPKPPLAWPLICLLFIGCQPAQLWRGSDAEMDEGLETLAALIESMSFEQACLQLHNLCESEGRLCEVTRFFCDPSDSELICLRLTYACQQRPGSRACRKLERKCAHEPPISPDSGTGPVADAAPEPDATPPRPDPDAGSVPDPDAAADPDATTDPCQPTTCADEGKNCGTISDGCGATLSCGSCTGSDTCGGGGLANVCGHLPALDTECSSAPNMRYVDGDDPAASDQNSGSEGSPWRTIQHAASVVAPGQVVCVKPGSYGERVRIDRSGTTTKRIVFRAYARRTATVDGGFEINAEDISLVGFRITRSGKVDAVKIRGDRAEVADNYFFDCEYKAIRGDWGAKPAAVRVVDNHIYHCQSGIVVEGEQWLVEGNEVERLYNYGNSDCDYARFFGNDHVFRDNFFHGTQQAEIGSAHVDCFQTWDGGGLYAQNVLFESNRCFNTHQALMTENDYDNIHHLIFRRNVIGHGPVGGYLGYGLFVKGLPYITAVNNTFVDIRYRAIYIRADNDRPKYATIKSNIFYNVGSSYTFEDASNVGDYNLLYRASNPDGGPNDFEADPLFVDPAGDDYRLTPASPACGAGEGGVDIGAFPCP